MSAAPALRVTDASFWQQGSLPALFEVLKARVADRKAAEIVVTVLGFRGTRHIARRDLSFASEFVADQAPLNTDVVLLVRSK